MKRLSSIFSFSTLRRPRLRLPRAALLALMLLVGAEISARLLLAHNLIAPDRSLRQLVLHHLTEAKDHSDLWLLGNSTLAFGVDVDQFEKLSGLKTAKLTHGSATLAGTAQMLDFYLRHCPPPKAIVIFLSKDDLNAKGKRAEISRSYFKINSDDAPPTESALVLRLARQSILSFTGDFLSHPFAKHQLKKPAQTDDESQFLRQVYRPTLKAWSGKLDADTSTELSDLAANFIFDPTAVKQLADVCQSHHVTNVKIVLLPVTDKLIAFHNSLNPNLSYEKIREQLSIACHANKINIVDWGSPSANYALFRDPYHLNTPGCNWLTHRLAEFTTAQASTH